MKQKHGFADHEGIELTVFRLYASANEELSDEA
jgi:hypothetical protein